MDSAPRRDSHGAVAAGGERRSSGEDRVAGRCELCGVDVDLGEECRDPGAAPHPPRERARCSACQRIGCSRCLAAVEERADDFFLDLVLCSDCLAESEGRARPA